MCEKVSKACKRVCENKISTETKQKEKSGAEPLKEFVLQANWCCL